MAAEPVIYGKQMGEPRVPLTVRLEWLPDGKIVPLMYWMPDGSCFQIKHICEMTPLAFLKDGGEGLRFKVRSVIIESSDPLSDPTNALYETYLYFTHKWFCGKNIIDGRYGHNSKEYIAVTLDVFPDCDYELVYFKVRGIRYMVENTVAVEPRGSFHAGGAGTWHKIEARQVNADDDEDPDPLISVRRMAALYFELNKWFVMVQPA